MEDHALDFCGTEIFCIDLDDSFAGLDIDSLFICAFS
jgi:hypothetical protein